MAPALTGQNLIRGRQPKDKGSAKCIRCSRAHGGNPVPFRGLATSGGNPDLHRIGGERDESLWSGRCRQNDTKKPASAAAMSSPQRPRTIMCSITNSSFYADPCSRYAGMCCKYVPPMQISGISYGRDDVGLNLASHRSRPKLPVDCGCRNGCRFRQTIRVTSLDLIPHRCALAVSDRY
jgi:hypothetical protein